MPTPGGRPVAVHERVTGGETRQSVAVGLTAAAAVLAPVDWSAMGEMVTMLVIRHSKWAVPLNPAESVAVTPTRK